MHPDPYHHTGGDAPLRILVVDPLFEHDTDIERDAAGPGVTLVFRNSTQGRLDDDAAFAAADALLNCRGAHKLPAEVIAKMPKCRAIQQGGVGFNHIDLVAAARRGIPVMNTPDYGTTEVANHAVALALNFLRGIQVYDRRLRRGNASWDARAIKGVRRLSELRCGIVGLGRIGTAAALRFKALGMDVGFHDPYVAAGQELALGLRRFDSVEAMLRNSDLVSLHCYLSTETRHMINAESLKLLPEGAVLINTARGGLVDFQALLPALRSGRLAGAGIDVFEPEPLDRTDPLIAAWAANEEWLDDRLILTPHAAWYSTASLKDMRRLSMRYLMRYLRTGARPTCVNEAELLAAGSAPAAPVPRARAG
jgi:lactate dehydrogenase-like 2-hydroxyacid dehydrogenase